MGPSVEYVVREDLVLLKLLEEEKRKLPNKRIPIEYEEQLIKRPNPVTALLGEPVWRAEVAVLWPKPYQLRFTGADGSYELMAADGSYQVTAAADGYAATGR